jgi:hypothetical protein
MRPASPCHSAWTGNEHFQVGFAYVCIWQDINSGSSGSSCGTAWCVGAQGRRICRAAFGPGQGLAAFLLQGLSEEQWNQSRICADFGHAVSLCRMIASLRFSGGFDVIGTTLVAVRALGEGVIISGVHFPVCSKWVPLSRAKWPFLKRNASRLELTYIWLRFLCGL